jgi:hypothetical protein
MQRRFYQEPKKPEEPKKPSLKHSKERVLKSIHASGHDLCRYEEEDGDEEDYVENLNYYNIQLKDIINSIFPGTTIDSYFIRLSGDEDDHIDLDVVCSVETNKTNKEIKQDQKIYDQNLIRYGKDMLEYQKNIKLWQKQLLDDKIKEKEKLEEEISSLSHK